MNREDRKIMIASVELIFSGIKIIMAYLLFHSHEVPRGLHKVWSEWQTSTIDQFEAMQAWRDAE